MYEHRLAALKDAGMGLGSGENELNRIRRQKSKAKKGSDKSDDRWSQLWEIFRDQQSQDSGINGTDILKIEASK